jgi:hypothetical protein
VLCCRICGSCEGKVGETDREFKTEGEDATGSLPGMLDEDPTHL